MEQPNVEVFVMTGCLPPYLVSQLEGKTEQLSSSQSFVNRYVLDFRYRNTEKHTEHQTG